MFSIDEAKAKVKARNDVASVDAAVDYQGVYLVRVTYKDAEEAHYDPFFSVDKESGAVNEFSFLHDGDPREVMRLFLAAEDGDD